MRLSRRKREMIRRIPRRTGCISRMRRCVRLCREKIIMWDIDEDGYASREDMEAITSFDIRGGEGLADLTGLEAAVNLNWLTLEECGITSEFMEKNADVLAALPNCIHSISGIMRSRISAFWNPFHR